MAGSVEYGTNVKPICSNQCNLDNCEIGDLSDVVTSARLNKIFEESDERNCEEIFKKIFGNFINGKLIASKRK